MSVENYIKENASRLCAKVYVVPDISEKKLNNAISSMAPGINHEYVLAIADSSLLGNGKNGCLFLGDSVYYPWNARKTTKF
jgi:hypothetical protein